MSDEPEPLPPSRIRDHLANDRTYLAWVRTAANVMVIGLAVAKFADADPSIGVAAGSVLVATGAAGLVYGGVRYRHDQRSIDSGRYQPDTTGPLVASAVLVGAMVIALALLLLDT